MKFFAEITTVLNKYTNSFFLNVVDEPEQNLFLESQMKNMAFLLKAANVNDENKIVMTTHSLYVLSYITLAAKAYELMNKGVKCDFSTQKQNERQQERCYVMTSLQCTMCNLYS